MRLVAKKGDPMHKHVYELEIEDRHRQPAAIRFGNRADVGLDGYPLALFPLVRAFYSLASCRVVAMRHNAKLVPPWERSHGAVQVTKWGEAHHGAVVCLRLRHCNAPAVDAMHLGQRVVSRAGQKGVQTVLVLDDAPDMRTAYQQSVAICRALQQVGADGRYLWQQVEHRLLAQLADINEELADDAAWLEAERLASCQTPAPQPSAQRTINLQPLIAHVGER
jgi:hypothetical protein